jgi:hypothetical protein
VLEQRRLADADERLKTTGRRDRDKHVACARATTGIGTGARSPQGSRAQATEGAVMSSIASLENRRQRARR